MRTHWDAVVVGGSAAGLTAGTLLARSRYQTLIVDGGAPRNAPAAHLHGFLSRDGMAPGRLLESGREEFTGYGGTLCSGLVADAAVAPGGGFRLVLEPGTVITTRSVLVATGVTDELPELPGLAEHWGDAVHHCPHCHGFEVADRSIIVLGGATAAHAIHLAGLLRRQSRDVTLAVNGTAMDAQQRARLAERGVRVVDGEVVAVRSEAGRLLGLDLADGSGIDGEVVFTGTVAHPNDAIATALGCPRDPDTGLIAVDARGATGVAGVWAAGNVVDPRSQLITAAGAASAAAIGMAGWLLDAPANTEVAA